MGGAGGIPGSAGSASIAGSPASGGAAGSAGTAGSVAIGGNAGVAGNAGNAGTAGSLPALDAPAEAGALLAFLTAKQYAGWAKEGAYHASTGPHGDAVKVFYSPKAAAAVKAGAATLPMGAATVKELTSGGSLYGFAVWVKVQDATDGGKGYFWYEIIRNGPGKDTIYGNALGSDDCVGCHQAGKDYNLSILPFE